MTSSISKLEVALEDFITGRNSSKTQMEAIVGLCSTHIQEESIVVQALYRTFKKALPTEKLRALYVIDAVFRDWIKRGQGAANVMQNRGEQSNYSSGYRHIAEIAENILLDAIRMIPQNQKERLTKVMDYWRKTADQFVPGDLFPPGMLDRCAAELTRALGTTTPRVSRPSANSTPPAGNGAPLDSAALDGNAIIANIQRIVAQNQAAGPPPASVAAPSQPSQSQAAPPQTGNNLVPMTTGLHIPAQTSDGPPALGLPAYPWPMHGVIPGAIAANPAANPAAPPAAVGFNNLGQPFGLGNTNPGQPVLTQQALMSLLAAANSAGLLQNILPSTAPPGQIPQPAYSGVLNTGTTGGYSAGRGPTNFPPPPQYQGRSRERSRSPIGRSQDYNRGEAGRYDYRQRTPPVPSTGPSGTPQRPRVISHDPNLREGTIKVLSRTLFVGGVSHSEAEVRSIFGQFGIVQSVIVNIDKRHAFVKMLSRPEAQEAVTGMNRPENEHHGLRVRWGVGFGPRECSNYHEGVSVIPIEALTEADRRWLVTSPYGGTGGAPAQGGMVVEEPDIEIGAGVSSKAMSRRVPTDKGGQHGPRSSRRGGTEY